MLLTGKLRSLGDRGSGRFSFDPDRIIWKQLGHRLNYVLILGYFDISQKICIIGFNHFWKSQFRSDNLEIIRSWSFLISLTLLESLPFWPKRNSPTRNIHQPKKAKSGIFEEKKFLFSWIGEYHLPLGIHTIIFLCKYSGRFG